MLGFGPLSSTPLSALPIVAATGDAVFAGTATIVFGQTGELTANSAPAGTATITFAQTGALSAGSSFSGSTTIVFAQTGAFRGGAGFAGSIPIVFGQTGIFTAGSGFAGSGPITFGQTGAFTARSSFAGTATVQFGQTGAFGASSAYAGAATITFSQAGNFVAGVGVSQEIQFIGDGVGKGRERADKERIARERDLKAIIARSFEAVTGEVLTPASSQVSPAQIQSVAKRTFKAIETQGYDITLRQIERLVRAYERELADLQASVANDFLRQEDEMMMVMLLA